MSVPASYGGPGWRRRAGTHGDDVAAGRSWRPCVATSETGRLKQVLLVRPGAWIRRDGDPNEMLFRDWPDVARIVAQAEGLARFYEAEGVGVHWLDPPAAPPNLIFLRDLFFMAPEGAVLARPAALQRAAEPPLVQQALAALSIPILGMPRGNALFEGADALWLDARTVLVGIGHRTNEEGAAFLTNLLAAMGVETIRVQLPDGVQHLLGVVNFARPDLAAVRADKTTAEMLEILSSRGVRTVSCPARPGDHDPFGMNFVALSPGRVVMPAGYPAARAVIAGARLDVTEIDIGEYLKAMGGIGCLTGIVSRDAP